MEKVIHFRQVEWFGQVMNLPLLIHAGLLARPNVEDSRFDRDGETYEVRHRSGTQVEMLVHLASHVPGATKAIAPRAPGIAAADLGEASPPANAEFTEREIALVIRQNKLGYVVAGMTHPNKVQAAVRGLVALGHGVQVSNRLMLMARADSAMITALLQDGVDRIDLGLVLPSADADQVVEGQPLSIAQTIGRVVGGELRSRLTNDLDETELDDLEDVTASLRLKLRKRKPTLEQIQALTAIASDAVEGDEGFRIRTINKTEFTRDKLLLKSSFTHPNSTTLQYATAWSAISQFLDQT
jgi:hypothetical protein